MEVEEYVRLKNAPIVYKVKAEDAKSMEEVLFARMRPASLRMQEEDFVSSTGVVVVALSIPKIIVAENLPKERPLYASSMVVLCRNKNKTRKGLHKLL
mmetsp:Transcript_1544/g.1761  ORF Transcript_1544/g.1761 Transcript_1544/m.1761 type:complete len:98 (+) Transcript_1544:316-609(+)